MFGFPTQVRHLYTRQPRSSRPWPPPGAIDRDLRIAVSEFAPGNEIVLDKRVYRSVGCVGYMPRPGREPESLANPLGLVMEVGLCEVCRNLDEHPASGCPNCGAAGDDYRSVHLASPTGFRAEWTANPDVYDGSVERLSRAAVPRLTLEPSRMVEHSADGFVVRGGSTRLYTVNDNHGRGFEFGRASMPGHGWLELSAVRSEWVDRSRETSEVVLGARLTTDVLIAHASRPAAAGWSHRLPGKSGQGGLVATARRAGWTSLAFAFRAAAAILLQVEVQELEAGLRFLKDPGSGLLQPQVFLADTIENGAGYVTHLAQPTHFHELVDRVEELIASWADVIRHGCDTACYSCLKDYTNSAYHPLLDWRLAADVLDVVRYGEPRTDRWAATRLQAIRAVVDAFDWRCDDVNATVPHIQTISRRPLRVIHPLSDRDVDLYEAESDEAICDVFNLNRRPGRVYLEVVQ
jgi:hypothetical protein